MITRRQGMGLPWDAVLHSTRHRALTDLGAAGADAFTIQAIAGHASVHHSVTFTRFPRRYGEQLAGWVSTVKQKPQRSAQSWKKWENRAHPLQFPLKSDRQKQWWQLTD